MQSINSGGVNRLVDYGNRKGDNSDFAAPSLGKSLEVTMGSKT